MMNISLDIKPLSIIFIAAILFSCENKISTTDNEFKQEIYNPFAGPSPWPEIRKKRINILLPQAMKAANVDAWLVICRENNNDPLAHHVGGENAGGSAAFIFINNDKGFRSIVYSPIGEATALRELKIHDEVIAVERGSSAITLAAEFLTNEKIKNIAINSSVNNELADGLSFTQRHSIEKAFGKTSPTLVSAEELVYEWLSVKLPEEVEIMRTAAQLTSDWQIEAYQMVDPGKTTDADVAKFLKAKMAEYGVKDAWAPEQNPNVNSGPDRGHSHATDKIIMPGDVIQTDFGIKVYDMWVTDIQRFAYVLKKGETNAPDNIQQYWNNSKQGSRIALAAMKPGVSGYEVDKAQRDFMKKQGSIPVMWSTGHPVGYVAHDIGPSLGGAQEGRIPSPAALKKLKVGQTFAFDGFFAWNIENGEKTMSVEEMAVITNDGAEYLIAPQEDLILITYKK
jgi:Xaa-Pro aminopeptidase